MSYYSHLAGAFINLSNLSELTQTSISYQQLSLTEGEEIDLVADIPVSTASLSHSQL